MSSCACAVPSSRAELRSHGPPAAGRTACGSRRSPTTGGERRIDRLRAGPGRRAAGTCDRNGRRARRARADRDRARRGAGVRRRHPPDHARMSGAADGAGPCAVPSPTSDAEPACRRFWRRGWWFAPVVAIDVKAESVAAAAANARRNGMRGRSITSGTWPAGAAARRRHRGQRACRRSTPRSRMGSPASAVRASALLSGFAPEADVRVAAAYAQRGTARATPDRHGRLVRGGTETRLDPSLPAGSARRDTQAQSNRRGSGWLNTSSSG